MPNEHSVLVVMDYQQGIVDRVGTPEVLDRTARAVAAARASGIAVFFVRVAFRPGYPEISTANRSFGSRRGSDDSSMHEDGPAAQIHPALAPRDDEPIITKRRVSAFTGSDLDVLLRGARAEEIVLAGLATSGVVLSTLREAADLDYAITVLEDACNDNDPEVHRVLTQKVFPRQAAVTTVDEWIATLG
jgi:nicotinamidase-related amidase